MRSKDAIDGLQVNIPVLLLIFLIIFNIIGVF